MIHFVTRVLLLTLLAVGRPAPACYPSPVWLPFTQPFLHTCLERDPPPPTPGCLVSASLSFPELADHHLHTQPWVSIVAGGTNIDACLDSYGFPSDCELLEGWGPVCPSHCLLRHECVLTLPFRVNPPAFSTVNFQSLIL